MKKIAIFGLVLVLGVSSFFMLSACRRYEEFAGVFHAPRSGRSGHVIVLDLRANGSFSLRELDGMGIVSTLPNSASGTGRFSVSEDNRIVFTFDDGLTRNGRITASGNIDLTNDTIYGASLFRRQ